jgi:hypothetical protein
MKENFFTTKFYSLGRIQQVDNLSANNRLDSGLLAYLRDDGANLG